MSEIRRKDLAKIRALINQLRPPTFHRPWKSTGIAKNKTRDRAQRKSDPSKK